MGSLDHARTELFNLTALTWNTSTSYLSYTEIYSFATFFHHHEFYVVGGKTKNEILSLAARFNPITEKWTQIGNMKFPRYDHMVQVITNKVFISGGSRTLEYCDLTNDFACSVFTDANFTQEDIPILYGFLPSKCDLGSIYSLSPSL